jgi:hypothetical protein
MKKTLVALAVSVAVTAGPAFAQGGSCDRACLNRIADAYIAALVAHDPAKAPLAPSVKFTEQAQVRAIGEGLWKTALGGPTTFRIPVADPVSGQIGLILMMKADVPPPPARAGGPPPAPGPPAVQLALRLKVENQKITEAEHIYATITALGQLANLQEPRKPFFTTVPPGERSKRNVSLLLGNAYYDALMQSNGHVAPFGDDCGRRENGMHTAGVGAPANAATPFGPIQGCAEQLDSRAMSYITSIDLRRVTIVDEERGLVFGLSMFRHPMTEKSVTIVNKDGSTSQRPMPFEPFDLEAAHIFKISGDKIHEI